MGLTVSRKKVKILAVKRPVETLFQLFHNNQPFSIYMKCKATIELTFLHMYFRDLFVSSKLDRLKFSITS